MISLNSLKRRSSQRQRGIRLRERAIKSRDKYDRPLDENDDKIGGKAVP